MKQKIKEHIPYICFALVVIIIIVPLMQWLHCPAGFYQEVKAAGTTSVNASISSDDRDVYFYSALDTWANTMSGAATMDDTLTRAGWVEYLPGGDKWQIYTALMGFSAPSYNGTLSSARLYLPIQTREWTVPWDTYFSIYAGTVDNPTTPAAGDWDNAYDQGSSRLTTFEYIGSYPAGYEVIFDFIEDDATFTYLDGNASGIVWLYLMTTNQALNLEPAQSGNTTWNYSDWYAFQFDGASPPQLEYTYIGEVPGRESEASGTNAGLTVSENLTGITDNITWETPRTMYADETFRILLEGTPGTPIALRLLEDDGTELNSKNDWIQDDGKYYWYPTVPGSSEGFIQVVETNSNLTSIYAYVSPTPDDSQELLSTMALNTADGHARLPMTSFMVNAGGVMLYHWKTNIDGDTELGDYDLNIYRNGDSSDSVYTITLDDMADDYFGNIAANDDMLHWRFALFTPDDQAGFDDKDGLLLDLDLEANYSNRGFYTSAITDNGTDDSLTTPIDAYWYIEKESDGVIVNLTEQAGTILINAHVGNDCKVKDDLSLTSSYLINPDGTITTPVGTGISQTDTTIDLLAYPVDSGEWLATIRFSGANTDFVYVRELGFSVEDVPDTGMGAGIVRGINELMERYGMDNPAGHWMVILIGMVLLFIVAYKSEIMRVALPMLLLGLGMIIEWTDGWLVVLLALGAGLTLFGLLRKKIAGGGDSGGG